MKNLGLTDDGKSKLSRWIVVAGSGLLLSVGALIVVAIVMPKPSTKVSDQVSPVLSAEAGLAKARAEYLQMIFAIDVDPKRPGKTGLLQTVLIRRSAEQIEFANSLRRKPGSKFFGQSLPVVLYQLEQMNNGQLIDAQRGNVNEQRVVINLDGSKTPYSPTSTVLLGQALLDAAAFQMSRLEVTAKMTESDAGAFLLAQKAVNDNLALLLDARQDSDALQQFQDLQIKKLSEGGNK